MEDSSIWDDVDKATSLNRELSNLEKSLKEYNELSKELADNIELLGLIEDEDELVL